MRFLLAFCVCVSLVPNIAHAQGTRIFVIDVERVLADSIAGKAAKSNFDEELKKRQTVLDKSKSDFEKAKADFEKQAAVLSGDALNEKREALVRKEKELQRLFQDQREELGKRNQAEVGKILKQVQGVVESIAKEQKADLILEKDRRSMLFARPEMELTEAVIKALDNKITK